MADDRVSDVTRLEVWGMLCDLERSIRYYSDLSDRYKLKHRGMRYVLLLLAGGECLAIGAALVWQDPGLVVGFILAIVLGVLTAVDTVTSLGETASELRSVSVTCGDVMHRCVGLWLDVETGRVSELDARKCLGEVDLQWTRACDLVTVELHRHDNERAAQSAYRVIADRFGGRTVHSGSGSRAAPAG